MPKELMELMRHKSINTTMMFYVGSNAEKTAGILWEAYHQASAKQAENDALGAVLGALDEGQQIEETKNRSIPEGK